MISSWPCPIPDGMAEEAAIVFDRGRALRMLVVPALFDEANRLRRQTMELMRRLDRLGIDCFLPDLPGTGESLRPGESISLDDWRAAMASAAEHFRANHALALRGGALVRPNLPGPDHAPVKGATILRQLLRMRVLSAREAGRTERADDLLVRALTEGIELAGYRLGPAMVAQLEAAMPDEGRPVISQGDIGGGALWLRAEAGEDPVQADGLAQRVAAGIGA
ncbi:hypothetical protein H7F51_12485 [Novosphingobium flavum]|uniref:Uncharacterized protein n=1 Tax=Novosphingobium flavum TaxID=1778672 RepID=A0A7X1FSW1_9SPHN|nr:hypothetical protein [Novosphingobium flavum]MBC2666338.1 hypothetical protein [Novosphingobium flavum]